MNDLILASASEVRAHMLRQAGLSITIQPARIDEESLRDALVAEGARPRDIADLLADQKARKVANRFPEGRVLGCDQVLVIDGEILAKPGSQQEARRQLERLRGRTHVLISAAVLHDRQQPVWRQVTEASLTMRQFSDEFLDQYLSANWDSIRHSVGCYQVESIGVRLFSRIEGDWFTILGLPLVELLGFLTERGNIAG